MKNLILASALIFTLATTTVFANDDDKDKTKKKEKKAKLHKKCTVSDKKSCHTS